MENVAEQKPDLIQFAAGEVTEACAGAPQIVWGKLVDARASRGGADDIPKHFGRHAASPDVPSLVDRAEHRLQALRS